jgi:major membrane immunogen (membrane-anchored lipoprotein)
MKRTATLLGLMVVLSILFGCGGGGSGLEDGYYFAQQAEFGSSGWKDMVMLTVEGGDIVDVVWDSANINAGPDKITLSENGGYPMVERGGAQSEWHEQAALVEEYLLETQDPAKLIYNEEDGTTDAISGVSIHVNDFVELVNAAIEAGPTERGPYRDGTYSAEADEFPSSGWKDKVDLTVIGGHIVAAYWDPYDEQGRDKYVVSTEGGYGMMERGGARSEWHEQADLVEAALLESQDPADFSWDDEGYTDAISGVSIHVNAFFELAAKALEDAR